MYIYFLNRHISNVPFRYACIVMSAVSRSFGIRCDLGAKLRAERADLAAARHFPFLRCITDEKSVESPSPGKMTSSGRNALLSMSNNLHIYVNLLILRILSKMANDISINAAFK